MKFKPSCDDKAKPFDPYTFIASLKVGDVFCWKSSAGAEYFYMRTCNGTVWLNGGATASLSEWKDGSKFGTYTLYPDATLVYGKGEVKN